MKTLIKELFPPVVYRSLATLYTNSQHTSNNQNIKSDQNNVEKGTERNSEYYDEASKNQCFHLHYSETDYYPMWSVIVDRIKKTDTKCIFEVGCGAGQLATLLRDQGINQYIGLDFSLNFITSARKICPEFNFVLDNVFETDLFDTYDYDAVISTEFLEHVEGDLDVIKKVQEGKRFYGSVPNFPFRSHVRHFNSVKEVYDRYSQYFEDFKVDAIYGVNGKQTSRIYYLFEGIKSSK